MHYGFRFVFEPYFELISIDDPVEINVKY